MDSNFTQYLARFWEILHSFSHIILFTSLYVNFGLFLWISSTQYLKYKFEEINTKIELSLKQMNIRLLMNAIHEHNYVERLTRDINDLFSRIIFFMHYYFHFDLATFLIYRPKRRHLDYSQDNFSIYCNSVYFLYISHEYKLQSNMYSST